jgi:hypothetical protein
MLAAKRELVVESRNPFNPLLLLASVLFVMTTLAVALVPVLEDSARQAGQEVPPSPFRQALRSNGWQWLLYEVAAIVLLGLLSMGLDRLRRLQKERASGTMPPADQKSPPAEAGEGTHGLHRRARG